MCVITVCNEETSGVSKANPSKYFDLQKRFHLVFCTMIEDSEKELTELDIEAKTWNKIEKNLKSFGFREGAAKGRDDTLQEGFNMGYADGFRIGQHLGLIKGIFSTKKELGITTEENNLTEKDIDDLIRKACLLCSIDEKYKTDLSDEIHLEKFEEITSRQQSNNYEIILNIQELIKKAKLPKVQ